MNFLCYIESKINVSAVPPEFDLMWDPFINFFSGMKEWNPRYIYVYS